jgi:hypothetical protein
LQIEFIAEQAQLPLHTQRIGIEALKPLKEFFDYRMQAFGQVVILFQSPKHPLHAVEDTVKLCEAAADVEKLAAGRRVVPVQKGVFGQLHISGQGADDAVDILGDGADQQVERRGGAIHPCAIVQLSPDDIRTAKGVEPGRDDQVQRQRNAERAYAGCVAHVEVAFQVVQDTTDRITLDHGALMVLLREKQFAGGGGQHSCALDPHSRAMVGKGEVQPAKGAGMRAVAKLDLLR